MSAIFIWASTKAHVAPTFPAPITAIFLRPLAMASTFDLYLSRSVHKSNGEMICSLSRGFESPRATKQGEASKNLLPVAGLHLPFRWCNLQVKA